MLAAPVPAGPRSRAEAVSARPVVRHALGGSGRELDPQTRHRFETRFGTDFSQVRVYTDAPAGASALRQGAAAFTAGHDIAFAAGQFDPHTRAGQRLLAHELAHVAQGQPVGSAGLSGLGLAGLSGSSLELAADRAAEAAVSGARLPASVLSAGAGSGAAPVLRQALADPFDVLRQSQHKLTGVEAAALLTHYETLSTAARDATVLAFHHPGAPTSDLTRWLAALDPATLRAHRDGLSDIGERVQRLTVDSITGKNLAQLGAAQAAFIKQGATSRAQATATATAARTGQPVKPVTDTDVAREHTEETKRSSPISQAEPNAWDALANDVKAGWNARAATAIAAVVQACARQAPEAKITAANLRFAPRETLQHGGNVFAFSGDPLTIGMSFVETAEADPAYVVSVVIHEIAGHPEFGNRYGSYEAQIYAEAHKQDPSLGLPWDTRPEQSTYGYIGTEVYAALREVPYERRLSPEDQKRGLGGSIPPEQNVDNKIGLIRSKYPPGIAEALVQGLYERFRIDPRLSEDALALFESVAAKHFPGVLKGVPHRGPRLDLEPVIGVGVERAGGHTLAYTNFEANAVLRWTNVALSAGLRLELTANDRSTFVRIGGQGQLHARLFGALYGDLRGGYLSGVSGAGGGITAGGGLSLHAGPVELGLVYDYLKAADTKDPDAHRAFVTLGLRL